MQNSNGNYPGAHITLPRLLPLDALRIIALLQITIFHQNSAWLPSGYLAVSSFFILSAYLLLRSYLWQRYGAKRELLRRYHQERAQGHNLLLKPVFADTAWSFRRAFNELFKRLLKLYLPFLLMLMTIVILMLLFFPAYIAKQTELLKAALLSFNNWQQLFNGVSYFKGAGFLQPFTHIWALSMEWQFYILLFLLFIPLYQYLPKRKFGALCLISAVLATIGLFISAFFETFREGAYFNTLLRFAPFACGMALAAGLTVYEFNLYKKISELQLLRAGLANAASHRQYREQLEGRIQHLETYFAEILSQMPPKIYVTLCGSALILLLLPFLAQNLQAAYIWEFTLYNLAACAFIAAAVYFEFVRKLRSLFKHGSNLPTHGSNLQTVNAAVTGHLNASHFQAAVSSEVTENEATGILRHHFDKGEAWSGTLIAASAFAYYIYLWHYPIRALIEKAVANLSISVFVFHVLCLALTLLVALAAYKLHNLLLKLLSSWHLQAALALSGALVIAFFPYQLFGRSGQANIDEIENKINSYEAAQANDAMHAGQWRDNDTVAGTVDGSSATTGADDKQNTDSVSTAVQEASEGETRADATNNSATNAVYPLTDNTLNSEDAAHLALFERKMAERMQNNELFKLDLRRFENIRLGKYTIIGDSIGVFLSFFNFYYFPNMNLDVKSVRQITAAKELFEQNLAQDKVGDAVIFLFGTNGTVEASVLEELYQSVHKTGKKMLLATVVLPWLDQESANNKVIKEFAAAKDDVYLIDWHQAAKTHSEYFESDNIHPSAEGCEVFMHLISKQLTEIFAA